MSPRPYTTATGLVTHDPDGDRERQEIAALRREDREQAALEAVGVGAAVAGPYDDRDPEDERGLRERQLEEARGGWYDESGGWQ